MNPAVASKSRVSRQQASSSAKKTPSSTVEEQVKELRVEVEKIRFELAALQRQANADIGPDPHPWMTVAASFALSLVLGKMIKAFRLPPAANMVVPLLTAKINRTVLQRR